MSLQFQPGMTSGLIVETLLRTMQGTAAPKPYLSYNSAVVCVYSWCPKEVKTLIMMQPRRCS